MTRVWLLFAFNALSMVRIMAQDEHSEMSFALLRQDDQIPSYSVEEEPSLYHGIKYMPIFSEGFISFGGSYRGQFELFQNEVFSSLEGQDNSWYLQRFLFHADAHFSKSLRLFGELGSSVINGKNNLAPVDRDELYINQLFLEWANGDFALKVGRENLKIGSRRLVDPREGPNVRRSIDHVSAFMDVNESSYRLFAGSPVAPEFGVFDNDVLNGREYLWGLYGEKLARLGNYYFDGYYLGNFWEEAVYEQGVADETRHSFGGRFWGEYGSLGFDNEAILQLGTFGDVSIFAWTASINTWWNVNSNHRLGVKSELISGDRSGDNLNTFNPIYPRGAYFGRVARFGPSNLIDIHPYWSFTKGKLFVEIDYDVFWKFSVDDAVYDPALNIVLVSDSNRRFIAQQIGTLVSYEFNPFASIELETNYILIGNYIEESVIDPANLFHMVFTAQLRF